MITAWLLFKRRMTLHWKSPLSLPLLLFTLWAGLSVIWSLDRGNTIHDFRAFWLEYVVLYFLIVNFFNSRKKFVVLAWVFIASSTIFSIWQIWSFYFKGQGQRFITKLSTGLPAVPVNWIGFFVVFAITLIGIVVFDRNRAIRSRVLASFCFIPLFLLIFSTQSRATFGALIVGLAIVFANRKKVFLFFLIIVAVAVMYSPVKNRFYAMYDSPPDIRLAMTLTAIEVVKD
ncbi:MAG: hypothetical protein KKA70_04540, partial [Proteobacteria bacterium]|nr:hypothetical protein [Pseudomonadota bacterium]